MGVGPGKGGVGQLHTVKKGFTVCQTITVGVMVRILVILQAESEAFYRKFIAKSTRKFTLTKIHIGLFCKCCYIFISLLPALLPPDH